MILSKDAIRIIRDAFQHFADDAEDHTLEKEYLSIKHTADLALQHTHQLTLKVEEVIPTTKDPVLNLLAEKALPSKDNEWGSENQIDFENGFFHYIESKYSFDPEDHEYLLRATTEEAIRYVIKTLNV